MICNRMISRAQYLILVTWIILKYFQPQRYVVIMNLARHTLSWYCYNLNNSFFLWSTILLHWRKRFYPAWRKEDAQWNALPTVSNLIWLSIHPLLQDTVKNWTSGVLRQCCFTSLSISIIVMVYLSHWEQKGSLKKRK